MKSYFKKSTGDINKIENVTDDKELDALVTGLHMRTFFWIDVQNSQPKTYTQLVDLIQREIQSEETIENREKAEREKWDLYCRERQRSPKPRNNHFRGRCFPKPRTNRYQRFYQMDINPTPTTRLPVAIL